MTYRNLKPWPPLEDFIDQPLGERIRFVRTNLKRKKKGGRIPYLSVDEFAEVVGATGRHRVIGWETKGETPRDYAVAIANLTPYPPAALGGDGEVELLRETYGHRLRSLEGEADRTRQMFAALLDHLELEVVPGDAEGGSTTQPIQLRHVQNGKAG